jgi:hypothetical protein
MLSIRCKNCNKEITGNTAKSVSCGCPNMATINGDKISAVDLTKIVMLNNFRDNKKNTYLTNQDLMWQEERKKRKVKKLDFEIR